MTNYIYDGVELGENATLGHYVVLGEPARGRPAGEATLTIGSNAVIRSHTVIYAGTTIGDRFQTGHGVMIREENVFGHDCSVGTGSIVEFKVTVGNGVRLHSRVFVPEFTILDDDCWLGPNVVITNAKYPAAKQTKAKLAGVRIGSRAKIGANSTILPGVVIGNNALIGAGAVVTRDVPEGAVFVGNPARQIAWVADLKYSGSDSRVY